ncbi:MAG: O-antigen ligase family protein [Myxococcales bacterium]|nr:O-antigen ligase family protein [Myxococcales bacterium]
MSDQSSSVSSPLFRHPVEGILFIGSTLVVFGVALFFDLSVNRVFDVPKAMVLKTCGGGLAAMWLIVALYGRSVYWRSAAPLLVPVVGLVGSVIVSTALSIDFPTSLYGVYERQFGLQGFLASVGLFFLVATTTTHRRTALLGLAALALVGGMLGAYAFLQSQGHDPWTFFREPHNKVYSFLGNATFAGNALALIFPVVVVSSITALTTTYHQSERIDHWGAGVLLGFLGLVSLLVVPGYYAAADLSASAVGTTAQAYLRFGYLVAAVLFFGSMGLGSMGLSDLRYPDAPRRRFADAIAVGGGVGCTSLIAIGLVVTRTRGAWVAVALTMTLGVLLLPYIWSDKPKFRRQLFIWGYSSLLVMAVGLVGYAYSSTSILAYTIRSIPEAFDTSKNLGKGQGTRPYLWMESFRVLTEHNDTLSRIYEDEQDLAEYVLGPELIDLPFETKGDRSEMVRAWDRSWRNLSVWFFGIGIETYRYAFMSHKSKRLEELDPMTNHDNPHNNYLYVLASFGWVGLFAYLWLLFRIFSLCFTELKAVGRERWERTLIFGILLSFVSYLIYSVAGFDSVACSVFFYYLLGLASYFLRPNSKAASSSGKKISKMRLLATKYLSAIKVTSILLVGPLLLHAAYSGWRLYRAERAFTGYGSAFVARNDDFGYRVGSIMQAITLAPHESYYKQSLGMYFLQLSREYMSEAKDVPGKTGAAIQARSMAKMSELSLLAALDHAWAPENIYITLFQVYYGAGQTERAEWALERALRHSPHLGAVRANLAALKLQRKAYHEALVDCRWVLEVDKRSKLAFQICGQALLETKNYKEAKSMLTRAQKVLPEDSLIKTLMLKLDKASSAMTSP